MEYKQLLTEEASLEQMQVTLFKVWQVDEDLVTWATQANKQAGGVAKTSLDRTAKDKTAEKTVEKRIMCRYLIITYIKRIDLFYLLS